MRIVDESGKPLPVEKVDLNAGSLVSYTTIKENAEPLSKDKTYWADDDWEEVQMYVRKPEVSMPTQMDRVEAQATYTAMMTGTILEVIT